MKNFSTTQATNISAFAGAILVVINFVANLKAGIPLDQSGLETFIGASIVIVATITSFVNRYNKGDITPVGTRKKK
jgi:hypothetical protein